MFVKLLVSMLVFAAPAPPPAPGTGGNSSAPPPAISIANARSVSVRDASGGLQRFTSIPRTSLFSTYGGGTAATCTFTADHDGFVLSNGDVVSAGTVVTSNYVFLEGAPYMTTLPANDTDLAMMILQTAGPIETASRTFTVFCDSTRYAANLVRLIQVPFRDPFLDPVPRVTTLRNGMQLDRPVVFRNPVVDQFGGLVTRYPTWLAIGSGAWRIQRSAAVVYRGATLLLIAEPRELSFVVDFVPNPDKPSPAFRGVVGCIPNTGINSDGTNGVLPAFPVLPDQTEPGVNGPCMWTPPGPGTVTITAQITYTITFWVDGHTRPDADYVWSSAPTTFDTGELVAVNTKP
jgi:hypothetical protein